MFAGYRGSGSSAPCKRNQRPRVARVAGAQHGRSEETRGRHSRVAHRLALPFTYWAKRLRLRGNEAVEFFFPITALSCYETYDCTGQQLSIKVPCSSTTSA